MSIKAKARAGARKAFTAAGDTITRAVLRLGATEGTYDADTDTAARTWAFEKEMDVLAYDDADKKNETGPENWQRAFLFLMEDMGTPVPDIKLTAEIDHDGKRWVIIHSETEPGGAIAIFYARDFTPVPPPPPEPEPEP